MFVTVFVGELEGANGSFIILWDHVLYGNMPLKPCINGLSQSKYLYSSVMDNTCPESDIITQRAAEYTF